MADSEESAEPAQAQSEPAEPAGTAAGPLRMGIGVALTGVCAGVGGVFLTLILHGVQHLAFGYTETAFLQGVEHASSARRVLAMALGGAIVGVGWWWQRRSVAVDVSVGHALANPRSGHTAARDDPRLRPADHRRRLRRIPRARGGAAPTRCGRAGPLLAHRLGLNVPQRRTVMACGAGAGLAAVYNVPLGGAVFTMEILLVSIKMRDLGPALAASGIATVIAWPVLSDRPTYRDPGVHAHTLRSWSGRSSSRRSPVRSGWRSCG